MPRLFCIVLILSIFISFHSCTDTSTKSEFKRAVDEVIIHELTEAANLNPVNASDVASIYVIENIFYSVISIDPLTLEMVPVLAQDLPLISENEQGEQVFTYEIRPEAKWNNGDPIMAKDVEFTLKVIKNPKVDGAHNRVYFDFVSDFILYPDNPRKFSLVFREKHIKGALISGDIAVLPRSVYDPKGLMDAFTVKELSNESEKLAENPKIIEFAQWFNSEKFQRDKNFIIGCGPYELEEWITGQKIVLKKKGNWWGEALKGKNSFFDVEAKKLTYQIINDYTAAITSLKAENIDVMRSIPSKKFLELKESENDQKHYNFFTPDQLAYYMFGINSKLPKFSDKKTRQALAHLVDVQKMIKVAQYNMATPTIGPVYQGKKKFYNSNIKPYEFDLEKAKTLLKEAGWKDSDGNGIVDKRINGKQEELKIKVSYNSGNESRKMMASIFQEEARKVGIDIEIIGQEMSVFVESNKTHNFEIYIGGFQMAPAADDPKQVFHSSSASNGGSNYVSFGTEESDKLIDKIRTEFDEDKRAVLYKRLQEIIHDEACHIFVYFPQEKIAIHKRFHNPIISVRRPGYWAPGLKALETN